MSDVTHTAGRWYATINRNGAHEVRGPGAETVALIFHTSDGLGSANADLIAAAPDLYEALKLAEDVLSRFPFTSEIWPNGTHPNTGVEMIRAALLKASS